MPIAQELIVQVTLKDARAQAGLKKLDKSVDKSEKNFKSLGATVAKFAGPAILGLATLAVGKFGKELIDVASDAEEVDSKFNTVFKSIKAESAAAANELSESFGLASTTAKKLLGDTGDLLTGFGFTQDSALELSQGVNKLAVDLASFTNYSGGAAGASAALTKALLGERESIKSLGIAIMEADIKQLAEDKGIVGELSRQQKAALTLELAITQSKNAIGDFARTQQGFANQSRMASENVLELKEALGRALLPAATSVLTNAINPLLEGVTNWINKMVVAARATKVLAKAQNEWQRIDFETVLEAQRKKLADLNSELDFYEASLESAMAQTDSAGNMYPSAALKAAEAEEAISDLTGEIRGQERLIAQTAKGLSELKNKYTEINTEVDTSMTSTLEYTDALAKQKTEAQLLVEAEEERLRKLDEIEAAQSRNAALLTIQNEQAMRDARMINSLLEAQKEREQELYEAREAQALLVAGTFSQAFVNLADNIKKADSASVGLFVTIAQAGTAAIAAVVESLGQQFAVQAAGAFAAMLAGDVTKAAAFGQYTLASAGAYAAAGAIRGSVPNLADGGIITPSPGGTLVNVAERGRSEAVVPLDKGMGGTVIVVNNITNQSVQGNVFREEDLFRATTAYQSSQMRGY